MNPLPPNADELVSAYLDGEAAPDEIALVESSPELLNHAESMRAVLAPLTEPVAPSPAKEAHLSAALDLFDDLFAAEDTAGTPTERPHLAALPDIAAAAEPAAAATSRSEPTDNVSSFEEARERRQRRVSPTVIAAAIAAVALLLFAIFSAGTANDDVATGASEAVQSTSADSADAAADDEDAMDDEPEEDTESRATGGLSDAEAPQAAAPAEEAMDQEETMAEAAMDEDEAMDDEEAMEEESAVAMDEGGDVESEAAEEAPAADGNFGAESDLLVDSRNLYLFGEVPDGPALERQLVDVPVDDLRFRAQLDLEGLFPRCRFELDELPDDGASLIGEGIVDQMPVEVHLVETEQERRIYVVAADACRVVFDFALGG